MIFNSLIAANDYNFGTHVIEYNGQYVSFLPISDLLKALVSLLQRHFYEKSCKFFPCLKPFCKKKNISFGYLWTCQLNNVTLDLICISK